MREYEIVSAGTAERLAVFVNDLLAKGWQCQGGVAIEGQQVWFYQAMTRVTADELRATPVGR